MLNLPALSGCSSNVSSYCTTHVNLSKASNNYIDLFFNAVWKMVVLTGKADALTYLDCDESVIDSFVFVQR